MTTKKSTKTAAPQAPAQETDPTNTDQDQTFCPQATRLPVETDPTNTDQDQTTPTTPDAVAEGCRDSGDYPGNLLTATAPGLTPRQQVTAILAGGIIGGMLSRTKPYETLDLCKVVETLGMCSHVADRILLMEDDPHILDS